MKKINKNIRVKKNSCQTNSWNSYVIRAWDKGYLCNLTLYLIILKDFWSKKTHGYVIIKQIRSHEKKKNI